jgi:hypothetical protein
LTLEGPPMTALPPIPRVPVGHVACMTFEELESSGLVAVA